MSGALETAVGRAKQRYIDLKVYISTNFICENVPKNLLAFQQQCGGHLHGPGQYMNLSFFEICTNLESISKISYKKLDILKAILKTLPVAGDEMVELVDTAEQDIRDILSGGTAVAKSAQGPDPGPSGTASGVKDTGEGFHQKESQVMAHDDFDSISRLNPWESVGFINVDNSCGTGFRVGDQYVMTAYHTFKDKFETLTKQTRNVKSTTEKPLSEIFTVDEGEDIGTCVDRYLAPTNKELRYQTLLQYLEQSFRERIEKRWKDDTWIAFNKGKKEEMKFGFDLDVPFADEDKDILILKLRVDDGDRSKIPQALELDEFEVDTKIHLIGYLKSVNNAKSLNININCQVYNNDRELENDVKRAQDWWAKNMPAASLDACFYKRGKVETADGRTILHASEEFEHRSSGSPGVKIDNYSRKGLFVQLMYLSGYPTRYYETGKVKPPLQYCFESGVSMKRVAEILSNAGQSDLKNAVFS